MPTIGENLPQPILQVRHTDLERVSYGSPFRSFCPVCKEGLLLVRRVGFTLNLSKYDNCSLCAQRYQYMDAEIAGLPLLDESPWAEKPTVHPTAWDHLLQDKE